MPSNRDLFEQLLAGGQLRLRRSDLFDTPPSPLPADFSFDRVKGMLLGLAIGDALGNTSEGRLPHARFDARGEIRDYLPNKHADDRCIGLPSDDTQLAFWTLEQMIEDRRFDPQAVARRFCQGRIFGIGKAVSEFVRNRLSGTIWHHCGPRSAGNGALMRIAPVVIPHLKAPSPDLWVDTALCATITHNDSGSTAACLAFVNMIWQLLCRNSVPDPEWWMRVYVNTAGALEMDEHYRPRGGEDADYEGQMWRFVQNVVTRANREGLTVLEASDRWYSGAYLLETIPFAILILMKHGHAFEEAVVRAVNDTKDNDTIAAIVGAVLGALHGTVGIPKRWIDNLKGRTACDDDGRVFELIDRAEEIFWR